MNFIHHNYLFVLIFSYIIIVIGLFWNEINFFKFIKEYWFYKRSLSNLISSVSLIIGFFFMAMVLLDPRGPEQKIKAKVKKDQTILLIDTSTSMLAEDVKPNRIEKAVWMAKHFARNAVGHELGVLIFADITKKLVPFTNDIDLLESRLDSIKEIRNLHAGSSIELAIAEAVRFFPNSEDVSGNIVVFTDGEENGGGLELNLPENVHVIMVGVGTTSGAPLPLRDSNGLFFGNKKFRGETVISKLNEKFFSRIAEGHKNITSILPKSFEIPTDEIMSFLKDKKTEEQERDNIVRPVDLEKWIYPASVFLSIGFVLRMFNPFVLSAILLCTSIWANDEIQLSEKALQGIDRLKNNQLSREQKIKLADQLVIEGANEMARPIYQEELGSKESRSHHPESVFNWATMELKEKDFPNGMKLYKELLDQIAKDKSNKHDDLKEKLDKNIEKIFSSNEQQNKDKKNQDQKNQEENKNGQNSDQQQKNSQNSGEQSNQDNKSSSNDNNKNKDNPFDPKNKDKDKDQKQDSGEKKKEEEQKKNQGDEGEKKEQQDQQPQENENQEGQKREKKKLSPLLEQLKSDDRKLQLKLLDTGTQDRKNRPKKDW